MCKITYSQLMKKTDWHDFELLLRKHAKDNVIYQNAICNNPGNK